MYIDDYKIEVIEREWDERKQSYSKEKKVVAPLQDNTGISSKNFGKFLDDLSDNNRTFNGKISVFITIDKEDY